MNLRAGVAVALLTLLTLGGLNAEVSLDFCGLTCSQVEDIIKGEIVRKQAANLAAATEDCRCIFFHDCFVDGCDATVMITSAVENKADIDLLLSIDGFDPKTSVEAQCPVIVSCAEIRAIATRDLLTLAFVKAWYTACKKPAAILLEPTNKKFGVNKLFFQGPCQPGFIFKVDGMKGAVQNPESTKNTNKWLQFDKVESFTLMGKVLIDGEGKRGKKLWVGQYTRFMEQPRVNVMDTVVKGRTLLESPKPTKPNLDPGDGAHHN